MAANINDVRISDNGVVEWFDGVAWTPYRELPDPMEPTVSQVVFRGSNNVFRGSNNVFRWSNNGADPR